MDLEPSRRQGAYDSTFELKNGRRNLALGPRSGSSRKLSSGTAALTPRSC